MPKVRFPLPAKKPDRQHGSEGSASTIPRWITIVGILGGLLLGILGYMEKREDKSIRQQEQRAAAHEKLNEARAQVRGPGPVIIVSQEGYAADPKALADAVNNVDESISVMPDVAEAYALKAHLSLKMGKNGIAAALAKKALEIDPELPSGLNAKALSDVRAGDLEQAKTGFKRASEAAEQRNMPLEMDVARLNLASLLASTGDLDQATRELKGSLDNPATQPLAMNTLGSIFVLQGRLDEAVEAYQGANADESFIGPLQNLVCVYKMQGKRVEAQKQMEIIKARGGTVKSCDLVHLAPDAGMKGAGSYWEVPRGF